MPRKSRCHLCHFSYLLYLLLVLHSSREDKPPWSYELHTEIFSWASHRNCRNPRRGKLQEQFTGRAMSRLCPYCCPYCPWQAVHAAASQIPTHATNVNLCWLLRRDLEPLQEQSLDVSLVADSGNRSPWSPALTKGKAGNSTQAGQTQILLEQNASLQLRKGSLLSQAERSSGDWLISPKCLRTQSHFLLLNISDK